MYLQTQGTDTRRRVSRYEVNWEIGIHVYALPYVKVGSCCIVDGAQLGAL